MAREVERLNEEIIDLQRHNKTLLTENHKLRKVVSRACSVGRRASSLLACVCCN